MTIALSWSINQDLILYYFDEKIIVHPLLFIANLLKLLALYLLDRDLVNYFY